MVVVVVVAASPSGAADADIGSCPGGNGFTTIADSVVGDVVCWGVCGCTGFVSIFHLKQNNYIYTILDL